MKAVDARTLNRTTLGRQLLLTRSTLSVSAALERLVGLQAQAPFPPYTGLWTRLDSFDPDELGRLITSGAAVRTALMRATVHLVTDADARALRPLVQPVLDRWVDAATSTRLRGVDVDAVTAAARALLAERPMTTADLARALGQRWPAADPEDLGRVARARLPLVQLPPRAVWGRTGRTVVTTADRWPADRSVADRSDRSDCSDCCAADRPSTLTVDDLVRRYLLAFGPASVADLQKWCGLTRLREVVDRQPDLIRLRGPDGADLVDLADAPWTGADAPAPVRFLPEFDNLLLSYADGSRVLAAPLRAAVFSVNGIIRATVLVDGTVRARWAITTTRSRAVLQVTPLDRLTAAARRDIEREGARLLAFHSPSRDHDIRIG